ncbi:MAG: hypothetical protein IJZ37_01165, partial [Clostridia bacterium]|nr:hypothetical protein [Clostridia bacterium]
AASLEGWNSTIEQHPRVQLYYHITRIGSCQVYFFDFFDFFESTNRDLCEKEKTKKVFLKFFLFFAQVR